ncbi:MAG: zinc-ribbon domain-containing protein, partial [Bacillota bacterium]
MFCGNCGSKLPDGAKFCMNCGTKTASNEPADEKAAQEAAAANDSTATAEMTPVD